VPGGEQAEVILRESVGIEGFQDQFTLGGRVAEPVIVQEVEWIGQAKFLQGLQPGFMADRSREHGGEHGLGHDGLLVPVVLPVSSGVDELLPRQPFAVEEVRRQLVRLGEGRLCAPFTGRSTLSGRLRTSAGSRSQRGYGGRTAGICVRQPFLARSPPQPPLAGLSPKCALCRFPPFRKITRDGVLC